MRVTVGRLILRKGKGKIINASESLISFSLTMCTLRAWGKHFDVDQFLAGSRLKASAVYRRGTYRYKKKMLDSGFNMGICNATERDLAAQARDVVRWLQKNGPELRRLRRSPGLEPVDSRLGGRKNIAVQCDRFPADLVTMAGKFGLELELSIYG